MTPAPQPLDALVQALRLTPVERRLVVVAGMADEHEGYGAAFAAVHPRGEARPTLGLFARLVWSGPDRRECLRLVAESALFRLGAVRAEGDAPWPQRTLTLAPGLWSALHGLDAWPERGRPASDPIGLPITDAWLEEPAVARALAALAAPEDCAVVLHGAGESLLRTRLWQLAGSGADRRVFEGEALRTDVLPAVLLHCLVRGAVPALVFGDAAPAHEAAAQIAAAPGPVLIACRDPAFAGRLERPVLAIAAEPPSRLAQRDLWRSALADTETADELAARYPAPAEAVARAARDAAFLAADSPTLDAVAAAVKARAGLASEAYARRVTPRAGWEDLVLAADKLALLKEAVERLHSELQVLDQWGFGEAAHGHRGLRLLFAGLPGTGKTLAAEVVAGALGADLLVVDLARVVSKWIGETEKNLALLFDQAESTRAVLFFDEADALFGKRTEVADAHDRYANIETSFLLARLERFDGVAVLATNLRQNLDRAFVRRFDGIIDFAEPEASERAAIWRRHVPAQAPLAEGVDLEELAERFPMSGAMIRNAALAAAFLAASRRGGAPCITAAHLHRAIRLEFEKAGRPHPA